MKVYVVEEIDCPDWEQIKTVMGVYSNRWAAFCEVEVLKEENKHLEYEITEHEVKFS